MGNLSCGHINLKIIFTFICAPFTLASLMVLGMYCWNGIMVSLPDCWKVWKVFKTTFAPIRAAFWFSSPGRVFHRSDTSFTTEKYLAKKYIYISRIQPRWDVEYFKSCIRKGFLPQTFGKTQIPEKCTIIIIFFSTQVNRACLFFIYCNLHYSFSLFGRYDDFYVLSGIKYKLMRLAKTIAFCLYYFYLKLYF